MLASTASRLAVRSIAAPAARPSAFLHHTASPARWTARISTMAVKRPGLAALRPSQSPVLRRHINMDKVDREEEKKLAQQTLKATPETVSTTSSVQGGIPQPNRVVQDVDMWKGIKDDLSTVKETFEMSDVPKQAYYIGLAGVLPYLATSASTVACAYEINHAVAGYGYMLSTEFATTMLHFLEPLQVGYGAVLLSFLGAIHWGLEFAGYGGNHGYKRYAIGVVAPMVAWPTVMMPLEYALISQFAAFTLLYYADTRATARGWTPPWYAIYRFTLTFIVGASIVLTLIGRGEIADRVHRIPGPVKRYTDTRETQEEAIAEEEEILRAQQAGKEAEHESDAGKKSKAE